MTTANLTSAAYARIVKQAWSDPVYKARLVADPAGSLTAAGVQLPAGMTVELVEDTAKLIHLVLPLRPDANDLDEEALDLVVGGIGNLARGLGTYRCNSFGQ